MNGKSTHGKKRINLREICKEEPFQLICNKIVWNRKYYHHLSLGEIAKNGSEFIMPLMAESTIFLLSLTGQMWLLLKLLILPTVLTLLVSLILPQKSSKLHATRKTSLFFFNFSINNEPNGFLSSLLPHFQEDAPEHSWLFNQYKLVGGKCNTVSRYTGE